MGGIASLEVGLRQPPAPGDLGVGPLLGLTEFIIYMSDTSEPDHCWMDRSDNSEGPHKVNPLKPLTRSMMPLKRFSYLDFVGVVAISCFMVQRLWVTCVSERGPNIVLTSTTCAQCLKHVHVIHHLCTVSPDSTQANVHVTVSTNCAQCLHVCTVSTDYTMLYYTTLG